MQRYIKIKGTIYYFTLKRKPVDRTVGKHLFKGFRYDSNGNPLYTCDTLSNEEAQAMGWKFSPKYGLYGQLSDPTMFYESKKCSIRLSESELKRIITEPVKKILKEDLFPDGIDITPARTAWEGISNALVNIQQYMDVKKSEFNREHELEQGILKNISNEDVEELVNYIHLTLNNVLKSTLPELMK